MDPDVEALERRVRELERRCMEETGADMATTMGALGKLRGG